MGHPFAPARANFQAPLRQHKAIRYPVSDSSNTRQPHVQKGGPATRILPAHRRSKAHRITPMPIGPSRFRHAEPVCLPVVGTDLRRIGDLGFSAMTLSMPGSSAVSPRSARKVNLWNGCPALLWLEMTVPGQAASSATRLCTGAARDHAPACRFHLGFMLRAIHQVAPGSIPDVAIPFKQPVDWDFHCSSSC